MKTAIKRRLKVYLPLMAVVIAICAVVLLILLNNRITAKDYFNALNNSNFTKQVQTTTIKENQTLVYEKVETIVFDGEKVYHKIYEKKLSADVDKDYDEITTEIYYSKDKMYYFDNNVWNEENFSIKSNLTKYSLKTEYFKTLKFSKKIETEGVLRGDIKNSNVKNIVQDLDVQDLSLIIVINKNLKVQNFNIVATTSQMRDVKIENVYTYDKEVVNLPIN